ncbi:hypothetical protein MFLAVUS_010358 [Mucor flavus]|uniref:BHLH domain-containing protein n=1 Tax=Mucor flavus TaxID=439312 RepID=A0ABP9ZCM6_9FUNG
MAQENTNFVEYNMTDYVANPFNNKGQATFIYQGYIPQSPETNNQQQQQQQQQLQCDDKSNTDTSCCTSPSSILSTVSIGNSLQFPTPSPSPYQHASENILTTRDNSNSFYSDFLDYKPFQDFVCKKPLQENLVFQDEKETKPGGKIVNSELRRQIHIQSEQKRRAQIKDGFEDLRNELPSCLNKKLSKVALLHRTVQHIQHLKNTQMTIYAELERLASENEQLKK